MSPVPRQLEIGWWRDLVERRQRLAKWNIGCKASSFRGEFSPAQPSVRVQQVAHDGLNPLRARGKAEALKGRDRTADKPNREPQCFLLIRQLLHPKPAASSEGHADTNRVLKT